MMATMRGGGLKKRELLLLEKFLEHFFMIRL